MTLTLYSATTCGPCKIVASQFKDAGVVFDHIELDLDEAALAELKARLNTDTIRTPLIIDGGTVAMTGPGIDPAILKDLIEKHRRDAA